MKGASDVATGYGKQQEYGIKAQDYLLDASSKATNYQLQGASAATNARLQAAATATNARFSGQQQQAQFGITSSQDLMQASQADTAAEFGKLQADMTDAGARDQLRTMLGNITTARAAGGADLTSPTTAALEGHVTGISDMNRTAAEASINAQTATEKASADYLRQASEFALTQGQSAAAMGEYNAKTAEAYGDYNAKTAETYADYNAKQSLAYGQYNADAAKGLGSTAVTLGYMNAATDVLGGLGKALAPKAEGK